MPALLDQPFWLDPSDPHRMASAMQAKTRPLAHDYTPASGDWGTTRSRERLGQGVHRIATDGISPEQAVDEAIARMKQILERVAQISSTATLPSQAGSGTARCSRIPGQLLAKGRTPVSISEARVRHVPSCRWISTTRLARETLSWTKLRGHACALRAGRGPQVDGLVWARSDKGEPSAQVNEMLALARDDPPRARRTSHPPAPRRWVARERRAS